MSTSIYFVSKAAVRYLKQRAEQRVSGVRSAHMSEVIATAIGFKTNAALCATLVGRTTAEASRPSNARAVQRLRQLGYNPPDNLQLLPELDRSYSPFRNYPLRKPRERGVRWNGWRNLMIAAINAGLEQGLFGLSPGEDWWSGADPKNNGGERGLYRFTFDGNLSATAVVSAIRGDELAIHVLLNPREVHVEADFNNGLDDGAACAHGWLERWLGAWLQDGGEEFSCKRVVQARVAAVKIEPRGYADQGSFIL